MKFGFVLVDTLRVWAKHIAQNKRHTMHFWSDQKNCIVLEVRFFDGTPAQRTLIGRLP